MSQKWCESRGGLRGGLVADELEEDEVDEALLPTVLLDPWLLSRVELPVPVLWGLPPAPLAALHTTQHQRNIKHMEMIILTKTLHNHSIEFHYKQM